MKMVLNWNFVNRNYIGKLIKMINKIMAILKSLLLWKVKIKVPIVRMSENRIEIIFRNKKQGIDRDLPKITYIDQDFLGVKILKHLDFLRLTLLIMRCYKRAQHGISSQMKQFVGKWSEILSFLPHKW